MNANLLAFDYGRKHVGVARALNGLAEPITTVATETVFSWLDIFFKENKTEALVVGLSEHQMAYESKKFGLSLGQRYQLPVYGQDETLSSFETRKKLAQAGQKQSKLRAKIDHKVAASFLQEFIDTYDTLAQVPQDATIFRL